VSYCGASSGIFDSPETAVEEPSLAKMDRLCRKLRLTSDLS
jgi:cyclopropane fatty-acyl-phospholipid synthase-like methyltransferase